MGDDNIYIYGISNTMAMQMKLENEEIKYRYIEIGGKKTRWKRAEIVFDGNDEAEELELRPCFIVGDTKYFLDEFMRTQQ